MYSLEYEMIIQMLQQFGYSGEVHAYLPPHPLLKGGGWAILVLLNGSVTSHVILDRNRQKILHDTSAYSMIAQFGVLEWQLINAPTPPVAPVPSETTTRVEPMQRPVAKMVHPRHQPISPMQMQQWSRLQRRVYLLADGTHSIEQIAKLLLCSSNTIERVIHDLQIYGAIE